MSKFGVVVVGYGRMGLIHARNVYRHPKLQLKYIVGRNSETLQEILKEFEGVIGVSTLEEALKDNTVNGVIVASPSESHPEHILLSVQAKKAVFCEKPIALDEESIKKCFKAAEENNVPLLCGYQRRFDPSLNVLKNLTQESQSGRGIVSGRSIGKPQLLRFSSRDHPPPPSSYLNAPSSGSFFDDFSTHDVDLARWITGEEPELVYATASSFLGSEYNVDDTAVVLMKFPSGALCLIDNSRQTTYGYDVRLEVLGEKGLLSLKNPPVHSVSLFNENGLLNDVAPFSFPERFAEAYQIEINHWVELLEGGTQIKVVAEDCIQASRITSLAQASREKQLPLPKAGSVVTPSFEEYPTIKGDKIGVCIFGTGRMGRVRADSLIQNPKTTLLYGVDIFEESAKSFAAQYNCEGYLLNDESLKKVLSDERVNCVIISTTSNSHCSLIVSSLNAGKHVFCEKPLALNSQDTETCVTLAAEKNLALYCGFQRRSDRNFMTLKKTITGTKQLLRVTSREPASNSDISYLLASGGFLFDSLIHDFDMARYFAEEDPIEVFCQGTAFNPKLREAGDVDAIAIVLRFPSGLIASIDNHRNACYGYDQRVEVHTSEGVFSVENVQTTTVHSATASGFSSANPPPGLQRYAEAYDDEIVHFTNLLFGIEKVPRSRPVDCLVSARIAEGAALSLKTGKPVSL